MVGEKALISTVSASSWGFCACGGLLKNPSDEAAHWSVDILRGEQKVVSETNRFVNHSKLAV